ncbi:MAG TPA: hypothetical protein VGY54_03785, partial [Polyangiaceae bacterium]|nr:hypothetical protein [Polyangiaceae bacterium]
VEIVLGKVMGAALSGAVLIAAPSAKANGRFPASNRIVLSPTDPNVIIVRATYGILPSEDHGKTWAFLCEDALGVSPMAIVDPVLELTAANALVSGLPFGGLSVSSDTGCTWSCAGDALAGEAIADIAVRPDAPHSVVALTSTVVSSDAGPSWHSQVFQSVDDGMHWAPLGNALDPGVLVTTIDVAPSDPHRLYVSATRGYGPMRTGALFVSMDDGATWTEHPAPLDTVFEEGLFIGGVDPSDADRVYVRTSGQPSRLLVTLDAGQSFQIPVTFVAQMRGFALSPDGSKIFVGGSVDGLLVGDRATLSFARRSSIVMGGDGGPIDVHIGCLAARGSELWACADEPSGFTVGVSTDDGVTFAPRLHLNGVGAPIRCCASSPASLACGADSGGAYCSGEPFAQLCANLDCAGPSPPPDAMGPDCAAANAGLPDAGLPADASLPADAGPPGSKSTHGSPACGCRFSRDREEASIAVLSMAFAAAMFRRRRRSLP